MTPSQRLLFMDLLRPKNKVPYIFILLILIAVAHHILLLYGHPTPQRVTS